MKKQVLWYAVAAIVLIVAIVLSHSPNKSTNVPSNQKAVAPTIVIGNSNNGNPGVNMSVENQPAGYAVSKIKVDYYTDQTNKKIAHTDNLSRIGDSWETKDGQQIGTINTDGTVFLNVPNVGPLFDDDTIVTVTFANASGETLSAKSNVFVTDSIMNNQ